MGRYSAHLVGESNYQKAVGQLSEGDPIDLVHEPENPFDDRAIKAVNLDGETVGYLERGSWIGRVLIDENKIVVARVHELIGGGRGQMLGVVLEVLTAKDAENPPTTPLPPLNRPEPQTSPSKRTSAMERAAIAALESAAKQERHGKSSGCAVAFAIIGTPVLAGAVRYLFA